MTLPLAGEGKHPTRPPTPLSAAVRIFDMFVNAGAVLAAVFLIAVMLATVIKIIFRYGLREGLVGIDQISGTMLLYVTFLGAAWVLRRDEHVTIDLLLSGLSRQIRRRLHILSSLVGAGICFCIFIFGTFEVLNSLQKGIRIAAEIEIPRAVNLVVIPLGCFALGLQFLRNAWLSLERSSPSHTIATRQD